jgi:hypothetical protein
MSFQPRAVAMAVSDIFSACQDSNLVRKTITAHRSLLYWTVPRPSAL